LFLHQWGHRLCKVCHVVTVRMNYKCVDQHGYN
jgi:hypothetical protein